MAVKQTTAKNKNKTALYTLPAPKRFSMEQFHTRLHFTTVNIILQYGN